MNCIPLTAAAPAARPRRLSHLALWMMLCLPVAEFAAAESPAPGVALVVHGGAGTLRRDAMSAELEAEYRSTLERALVLGHALLSDGGSSLDAVETTIRMLEDSPLFNAGRGAVFTAAGTNELDAAIMSADGRRAGAVAGVTTLKNPISAARAVMEHTPHVLLAGEGAAAFARSRGLEERPPTYFHTERRWRQFEERREREAEPAAAGGEQGTVGAVALDATGDIAAGTSTGGMTFKRHGRIGDSPLIGAGTYAETGCGVSATGHGEFFIRYAVAYDICARARYLRVSVAEAATTVIHRVLKEAGGGGGVIALDGSGRPSLVFNTAGMYRGWIGDDGRPHVAIYADDQDDDPDAD